MATLAQWPTAERLRALKRLIPRARILAVLRRTGHARRRYLRLPAWFMVWFVIALGLFCRDSYRQVFKWLQPFRRRGTPGRSTLCEARQRLGAAPLLHLARQVAISAVVPGTGGFWFFCHPAFFTLEPGAEVKRPGAERSLGSGT